MTIPPSARACSTTGTPTVSSRILLTYDLLVLACTAGFAAYDLRTKLVPDRAILRFCPIALMAPFLHALYCHSGAAPTGPAAFPALFLPALLSSLAGAMAGLLILLAAAFVSGNGSGIGGGDIKLAAAIGFAYGPYRMATILLAASGLAAMVSIAIKIRKKGKAVPEALSLPFVPFLAIGSLATTIAVAL